MADVEIRVTSTSNVSDLDKIGRAAQAAKRDLQELERVRVDTKINVDDSEIRRAENDIRDLDSIPPPTVKIDTNAQEAVRSAEREFEAIDISGVGPAIGGQLKAAFAAGGVAGAVFTTIAEQWGDDLIAGLDRGFNANRANLETSIRFGLEGIDLADVGAAAGESYAAGFGESLADVRQTAALVKVELADLDQSLNLESATRQAEAFAQVFGTDVPTQLRLVQRLVANELVPSVEGGMDLLAETAQRFPLHFEEMFEVLSEFSPVFGKLGVDGAQAMEIIGTTVREGLLPNVDRAAELFEEFNIEMTDGAGRARPVIEALGLSFEEMQAKIASGRGAEAMAEIAAALLDVGDEARRNELAVQLFGASIESASDPSRVLDLLSQADAIREVGGAADEVADGVEQMQTQWDKLSRTGENVGSMFGQYVAGEINKYVDSVAAAIDAGDAFIDLVTRQSDTTEGFTGAAIDAAAGVADLNDQMFQVPERAVPAAAELGNLGDAADRVEDEFNQLGDGIRESLDLLEVWANGQSSTARAVDDLVGSVQELDSETIDLIASQRDANGQFNLATVEGRAASIAYDELKGKAAAVHAEYASGRLTSLQYIDVMKQQEGEFRANAAAAGINESAIDALADSIFSMPKSVEVLIRAETAGAVAAINSVRTALAAVDGLTATTSVNTVRTTTNRTINQTFDSRPKTFGRAVGGVVGAQSGGIRDGLTLVGEEGPELVELPPGSMVRSNPDTEQILSRAGAGPSPLQVVVNLYGGLLAEREVTALVNEGVRQGLADGLGGIN